MDTINVVMPKELELTFKITENRAFTDHENIDYVHNVLTSNRAFYIDLVDEYGWVPMASFVNDIGYPNPPIESIHYGWVKGGKDISWSLDWEHKTITVKGYFLEV